LSELGRVISERVKELILVPGNANEELIRTVISTPPRRGRNPVRKSRGSLARARDDWGTSVITSVSDLTAAVARARLAAAKGDVVLLSPGLTWLPRQNEFARGKEFVRIVKKLLQ
jgi:UDP-N-acetylmuramoylalanine-D-glutamate ligase